MSMWVYAAKTALSWTAVTAAFSSVDFAAEAFDTTGAEQLIDGSASVVLLGVASAAIYALLRGHIVPMATFDARLQSIERSISDAARAAEHGAESLVNHARETAESSKRIEAQMAQVLSELRGRR